MIVMKFGGTSVEDALAINNVIEIINHERERPSVVVLSAIAGATNALISALRVTLEFNSEFGLSLYTPIVVKYRDEKTDAATVLEKSLR